MAGKGDDKGELEQLRRLEGEPDERDLDPGHIVRPADTEDKGEQHQPVGQRYMQPPQVGHRLVVHSGEEEHRPAAEPDGDALDDGPGEIDIARIPDAQQQHYAHRRGGEAQPPYHLVRLPEVADHHIPDALHHALGSPSSKTLFSIISHPARRRNPPGAMFTVSIHAAVFFPGAPGRACQSPESWYNKRIRSAFFRKAFLLPQAIHPPTYKEVTKTC